MFVIETNPQIIRSQSLDNIHNASINSLACDMNILQNDITNVSSAEEIIVWVMCHACAVEVLLLNHFYIHFAPVPYTNEQNTFDTK